MRKRNWQVGKRKGKWHTSWIRSPRRGEKRGVWATYQIHWMYCLWQSLVINTMCTDEFYGKVKTALAICWMLILEMWRIVFFTKEQNAGSSYSGPCDLRPLHFTIPSILRPAISDTILIFSIQISLYFKTTSNLRPKFYGWRGGLKM